MSPIEQPLNLSNKDVLSMLIKISEGNDPISFATEDKQIVLKIIYELKRGYVDPFLILDEWLKVEAITPPLQLLWGLDVENLLKLTTYIYFNKEYCTTLNRIISSAVLNDDEHHEEIKKILTYVLSVILNVRQCIYFQVIGENILDSTITKVGWMLENKHFKTFEAISNYISLQDLFLKNSCSSSLGSSGIKTLRAFLLPLFNLRDVPRPRRIIYWMGCLKYEEVLECFESNCELKWQYLKNLKMLKSIDIVSLNTFLLDHMRALLNHENSSYDFSFTLTNHTKLWTNEKLSDDIKMFLREMISGLDSKTVLNTLSNAVLIGSFNWKYLLSMISVFIQQQQDTELLKGLVEEFLKNSLEEKNKTLLLISLIVVRHCCFEKARYFNNYPTWFGSLNLKNIAVFTFFFECLTQIVPDEPPLYLKIHVNKAPTVPSSCRKNLSEYITLCKTRLSDLNESTDYIGIFNDYYEKDEEGQEADVRRGISLFLESQEIPKPLLEASVFRKQYYEKVFLKRLLSVPENYDVNRTELIKKLYSAGKISNTLYNRWVSLSK